MNATSHEIETSRMKLRPFVMDDLDALHAQWTEPGVRRYLWDDEIIPRETAIAVIESSLVSFAAHGYGFWVLQLKDADGIAGFCGFRTSEETDAEPGCIELLYGLSERWWGQGLAVEAARAVMNYGFERCGFKRILAITDMPNTASVRVMEKAGMSFVKRGLYHDLDSIFYEKTEEKPRNSRK